MPKKQANLKPLIDHAIGALGDMSGEISLYRQNLHKVKSKTRWTAEELDALRQSINFIATLCGSSVEEWEEAVGVSIP